MLTTQSESFQKFEFELLASISSNAWQMKIEQILITVVITVAVRPAPVAMLLDGAAVEPRSPCPDPSREKWREEEKRAQDPSSLSPLFLHDADHPALASTDPQHAAAETKAPQHVSEVAVPSVA
jgi:hypothetical protein